MKMNGRNKKTLFHKLIETIKEDILLVPLWLAGVVVGYVIASAFLNYAIPK